MVITDVSTLYQVMSALGSTQHAALKMRTLRWALSEDIKLQDIMYPVMGAAASGAEGIDMCWQWFQAPAPPVKAAHCTAWLLTLALGGSGVR